jgi:hypothetical protein
VSLSRSLSTPSRLRDVADLRKSVATARESILDISSLKAKSEKKGIKENGLLGHHKCGSQIRGKSGLVIEAKGN